MRFKNRLFLKGMTLLLVLAMILPYSISFAGPTGGGPGGGGPGGGQGGGPSGGGEGPSGPSGGGEGPSGPSGGGEGPSGPSGGGEGPSGPSGGGEGPSGPSGGGEGPSGPSGSDMPSRPSGGEGPSGPSGSDMPSRPSGGEMPSGPSGGEMPSRPSGGEMPSGPSGGEMPSGPSGGEMPSGPNSGNMPSGPNSGGMPNGPSGTSGPPAGTPVGPPAGTQVGPPAGMPVGPPAGTQVGPPAGMPVGPPAGTPVGPPAGTQVGPPAGTQVGPAAGTPVGPPTGTKVGPPAGTQVGPPAGMPKGTTPSSGIMGTPPEIPFKFNAVKGEFVLPNGKVFDINQMIMPGMKTNPNMNFDIPVMEGGNLAPVFVEHLQTSSNQAPPVPKMVQNEIKELINIDLQAKNVDKLAFTNQFKAMDISKLGKVSLGTLENLYKNATPDKLDITNPEVQSKMNALFQERNSALSIGEINSKLKVLNNGGANVMSISTDSLKQELANLENMKAQGIADPAVAKQVDDAIAKTKDAQITQTRLLAIRQQVSQLNVVKEELLKQSQELSITSTKQGLSFISQEKQMIDAEVKASGVGIVGNQSNPINALIEKYSAQVSEASNFDPNASLKLAALYEKANNMTKAQEILSTSLENNPNNDKVALELAGLFESSNNLNQASEVLKSALNRDPLPQTEAKLAEIMRELAKPAEAKVLIESAMQGLPKSDAVYSEASNIYKAMGDVKLFKTFVNGEKINLDIQPKIENGKVLIQADSLVNALGGTSNYNQQTKKMTITDGTIKIEVTIGNKNALVNGIKKTLDVAPRVENGDVVLQANFISDNLNQAFDYKPDTKMIIVRGK